MKKILTLLITLLLSGGSHAQFNLYWSNIFQHTGTINYSNEARKIACDASGNFFVLSDVTSDLDANNHPVGTTRYYLVLQKYGPTGTLLVQRLIDVSNMPVTNGTDYKCSFALKLDGSGGVYIGFNKYNTVGANYDVVVMKYANNLTVPYTFTYSTNANETGVDLTLRGTVPFLLFKSVSGPNTTYSVVKVVPNSTPTSPLYSFLPNTEVVNSIATTPTKNLFFTGYSLISGTKSVLIASVDNSSGLLKWKTNFNNNSVTGDDYGTKIIVGNDGALYVAGTTYTNGVNVNDALLLRYNSTNGNNFGQAILNQASGQNLNDAGIEIADGPAGFMFFGATHGTTDVYLYKMSTTTGLVVNSLTFYKPQPTSYTSLSSIEIGDMKVVSSGNVYLCGTVSGASAGGNFSASYLAKFGLSNGVLSVLSNAGVEGEFNGNFKGVGIAIDPSRNNLCLLRSYWKNNTTHAIENIQMSDFSMGSLRIGETPSSIVSDESVKIIAYPNPANGVINFKNDQLTEPVVLVYDLAGKLVLTLDVTNGSSDISTLHQGLYIFRMMTENGPFVQKIQIR